MRSQFPSDAPNLQSPSRVEQVGEGRLAHLAYCSDAPCDGDRLPLQRLVALANLPQGVSDGKAFNGKGI
jgi:hypothetical protein